MNFAAALFELLAADTAILSLIGTADVTRIFPMIVPQKQPAITQMPCLVYTITGEDRSKTYCGTIPLISVTVQLDSYGVRLAEAYAVSDAVKNRLMDYRGPAGDIVISDVALTGRLTAYDMEPGLMRVVDLYTIWYMEE